MEKELIKINPKKLNDNVFKMLEDDWMLITAGTADKFNTMTASWGALGILWNKPIVIAFMRPQRYTTEFVTKNEMFSFSFFEEQHRKVLDICGNNSGRTMDKVKECGITPVFTKNNGIYFKEARLVLECRKLYSDTLKPENFIFSEMVKKTYPNSDFHHLFIGEIITCLSTNEIIVDALPNNNIDNDPDL